MTTAKNLAIAGAAILSPFWLAVLKDASEIAAALLPFFGIALAVLQIVRLVRDRKH